MSYPLNDKGKLVSVTGFEPATYPFQGDPSSQAENTHCWWNEQGSNLRQPH